MPPSDADGFLAPANSAVSILAAGRICRRAARGLAAGTRAYAAHARQVLECSLLPVRGIEEN
jgi:hypothetical protein